MTWLRRGLALLLFLGLFWLAWQFTHRNPDPVVVDLIGFSTPAWPLWALLLGAFGLGAAATLLVLLYEIVRIRLIARRYRKAATSLESEVHQLRNLPLAEDGAGAAGGPASGERRA